MRNPSAELAGCSRSSGPDRDPRRAAPERCACACTETSERQLIEQSTASPRAASPARPASRRARDRRRRERAAQGRSRADDGRHRIAGADRRPRRAEGTSASAEGRRRRRSAEGCQRKQMVVIDADLARAVVMANVVIVGLRQRHVNHAENHDADSQDPSAVPDCPPPCRHDGTSFFRRSRDRLYR